MVTPIFMLRNGSGEPIQHVISCEQKLFRRYAATILLLKTQQKCFLCYHLAWSFKIFTNMFAFLYLKANSMEICEEKVFPSFFRKKAEVSIFVEIQG